MTDKPFYNVPDILQKNTEVKEIISEAILDLKYLSEEFVEHKVTGEYLINMLSSIVVDLEEAQDELVVNEEEE